MPDGQVQTFLQKHPPTPGDQDRDDTMPPEIVDAASMVAAEEREQNPDAKGKPQVAFPTAYALTRSQEDALMTHIFERKDTLEADLGRNVTSKDDWFTQMSAQDYEQRPFLAKREMFDLTYHNKVEWRKYCLGGIFAKSNLTLPVIRRVVRQMIARANNYFFSTDPWFTAYPVGAAEKNIADSIDRFTRFKLRGAKTTTALRKAIRLAFIRGEAVIKTTHEVREQIYKMRASVLVDVNEKAILDARGDYILESDLTTPEVAIDPVTQQPIETGKKILRKDNATVLPDAPVYVEQVITRLLPIYKGPRTEVCYYKDVLIPLTATSVHEADIVIQLFDTPVMEVVDSLQRQTVLSGADSLSQPEAADQLERAAGLIRDLAADSDAPKAARDQPRTEMGEQVSGNSAGRENPTFERGEAYLRYDADGDGIQEEIVVFFDVKTRRPIFYDYLANVFTNARRPYEVFRIHEIDGRWYGLGAVEMFEPMQTAIDLDYNRANFANSESGRVTFWDPSKVREGDSNPNLQMNTGKSYRLKPGMKPEEVLAFVNLPNLKLEDLQWFIEFQLQLVTNESGTANANDAAAAGLDSGELATGINNIRDSGVEMFSEFLSELEPGVESVLDSSVSCIFSHLDPVEAFDFFDGRDRQISELRADDVRHLPLKVDLVVTRNNGQHELAAGTQFDAMVTQFFAFPPEVQQRTSGVYITRAKALKIPEADQVFQPLAPPAAGPAPGTTVPADVSVAPGAPAPAPLALPAPPPTPAPAAPSVSAPVPGASA